ncbi:adenylate kinase isoenzyme 1 isoform X2 [Drosophila sulfurigaster albostrigata]|uniref:adenylate kinase n=1 Tax=Drosophila albomicans TaxID=7291 RepID=A0A6P8Y0Q7_DROAB|nr:adenylate kinase isoenzyme 1 isoform X1 [Drosophila albomicans]XP_060660943.1 adenylate kinase isoenzyme 1 isoform X2 [Drosophila nasuta]XP_062127458.1 adenylate kinase isoenzyme 1 isoform X2 [Drosophila sulfurigaster albostrigata]
MVDVPIIWILGGPGCGKGTQCAKIVEKYGFTHLSSGDLLREEVASGSDKGRELQAVMSSGGLVSNQEVLSLLNGAVSRAKGNSKGFLIDGYPREKNQGIAFEEQIAPADLALYFECSEDTMVQRILARAAAAAVKRADDNEATIRSRLQTFKQNTSAILEQYVDKTLTINAERDVDVIFTEVVDAIECVLKKRQKAVASC